MTIWKNWKKDSLTEQEKREKKRSTKKLKKVRKFLIKLKEGDLSRLENVEIMVGIEADDFFNEPFKYFLKKYQEGFEKKWEEVIFFFKMLIYYITVFTK